MSKSYLDCILSVPSEGCQLDAFKPCRNNLIFKTSQKCFYVLQCSFKIFMTVFTFLCVKANSKEIGEEILFPHFFHKNADVGIFVEIQG